jgi:hypothetical protein
LVVNEADTNKFSSILLYWHTIKILVHKITALKRVMEVNLGQLKVKLKSGTEKVLQVGVVGRLILFICRETTNNRNENCTFFKNL